MTDYPEQMHCIEMGRLYLQDAGIYALSLCQPAVLVMRDRQIEQLGQIGDVTLWKGCVRLPGRRDCRVFGMGILGSQFFAHPVDYTGPIVRPRLSEKARSRIPRAVFTIQE